MELPVTAAVALITVNSANLLALLGIAYGAGKLVQRVKHLEWLVGRLVNGDGKE